MLGSGLPLKELSGLSIYGERSKDVKRDVRPKHSDVKRDHKPNKGSSAGGGI